MFQKLAYRYTIRLKYNSRKLIVPLCRLWAIGCILGFAFSWILRLEFFLKEHSFFMQFIVIYLQENQIKKGFYYDPKKIADILHENVFMQMYEFFFKNDFTPLISVPNIRCLSSILLASYCHTVEIRITSFWRRIIFYSRLLLKESLGNGICFRIIIKSKLHHIQQATMGNSILKNYKQITICGTTKRRTFLKVR